MSRTRIAPPTPALLAGAASVAASEELTVLSADEVFLGYCAGAEFAAEGGSFSLAATGCSPAFVDAVRSLLHSGEVRGEAVVSCDLRGVDAQFHIFAMRMAGLFHAGVPVYHVLVADVSALVERERKIELEKRKYESISALLEDIPFEYDPASDTMQYAETFRTVFGASPKIHRFRERLRKGESPDAVSACFREPFANFPQLPGVFPERFLAVSSGGFRWFSIVCTAINAEDGSLLSLVGTIRNIDRQKREHLRLIDKSRTDAMTGLLNKATTEEEIREALAHVRPGGAGILLMIDLDDFKTINDTMGHLAGDEVLIQFARHLMRTFREKDIIGRVGGDEFHVFMRDMRDWASVHEKARELCSSVHRLFVGDAGVGALSVSIGIAGCEKPMPYGEVFRQADAALYRAKANGKNCYEVFGQASLAADNGTAGNGVPTLATRVARNSIVVDIIDTLFSAEDMRKGIDKALHFIGNALNISAILIYEKSFDLQKISVTHAWTADGTPAEACRDVAVDSLNLPSGTGPDGIFHCSDVQALPPEKRTFSKDPSVTSFLQCDIVRDAMVVGYISFEERGRKRIWAQQEIDALMLMAKLISGQVSQRQAARLLHQSNEATRDILNRLPGTSVCVISKATLRLLYFNGDVRERFPEANLGMLCRDLFKCREADCVCCPYLVCADGTVAHSLLDGTAFGSLCRLSVSSILWENREDAYVALVSEHVPSGEERELQKKKEAYIHALCGTYDYVLDIESETGRYTVLTLSAPDALSFPARGAYRAMHECVSAVNIAEDERAAFRQHFGMDEMRRAFEDGASFCELEHRWTEKGRNAWKHRVAIPYRLEGGALHILVYVRDISEQKEKEMRSREESANFLQALQASYTEIFRIDTEASTISPVYYNSEQVLISSGSIDLTDFIRQRARKRVHPDSVESFMAFYDPERVRDCIRKGETTDVEYRKRQAEGEAYRWIAATIQPVPGSPHSALMLLRDITRSRERENNFYAALRSSYDEIFEMDLSDDSVRVLFLSPAFQLPINLSFSYSLDTARIAEQCVHPEDRELFLAFYNASALRRRLGEEKKLSTQYRIRGGDGVYHWLEALVLPLPGDDGSKVLILSQDVTERKRIQEHNRSLEERYTAVFRQSCDVVTQIILATERYTQRQFVAAAELVPPQETYSALLAKIRERVHPDDWESVFATCCIENFRQAFEDGKDDLSCQFRLLRKDGYVWVENRVLFIREGVGEAFILTRNIASRKQLEEERELEAKRLTIALRDTYTEIYEFDLEAEVSRLLFSNSGLLFPVGVESLARTSDIIANALHPDDRKRVAANFQGRSLLERFERGTPEVTEEFRRIGVDGKYYWVSAVLVPIRDGERMSSKCMLFVKDISERKDRQKQAYITEQYSLALRNIYEQLYEFSSVRDVYRLIHSSRNRHWTPPENGSASQLLRVVARRMVHPEERRRFLAFFERDAIRSHFAENAEYRLDEFRLRREDGRFYWASFTMLPSSAERSEDESYFVFVMDIDARKRSEYIAQQNAMLERQRIADERYRLIVEQTHTLVFEWGQEGEASYTSPELVRRFAGSYDDRDIPRVWLEDGVVHPEDVAAFKAFLDSGLDMGRREVVARLRLREGGFIWCKVAISCQPDAEGGSHRFIGTLNDVDEATRSARTLRYRAEYDMLTGISNTPTFNARASQLIRDFPERQYYIIRMDIDRFKVINELYGMEEGDRLLKTIAGLFRERMTDHCLCSRLGGDVFCACVDFSEEAILAFVASLTGELASYPLPSRIVPSFGICRVDNVDTPINILCDWANLALKQVKGNVIVTHAFYDEKLREHILMEKKIESEMLEALHTRQFQMYLQPKVHIPTARVVGAEGLVRWVHPVDGLLSPEGFIPLFEKNGFIIQLDEYMWEQACICLRKWIDRGLTPMPVSVNVSRLHVHDTRLCEKLVALVGKYRLAPQLLELELTESIFLDSEKQLIDVANRLDRLGFPLSLDDFGAGYSALNALKNLPVKIIKIDRGFLNEVVATERGKTVIRHTISLAKAINMEVIAEGVETMEQARFLCEADCRLAQGYYYSRPVPVDVFERLAFGDSPFPGAAQNI